MCFTVDFLDMDDTNSGYYFRILYENILEHSNNKNCRKSIYICPKETLRAPWNCWLKNILWSKNKTHLYNIKFISKKYYTSSTILENHNLIKYLIIIEHFRFHKTCLHALVTTARSTNMYCYLYIYIYIYCFFFKCILYSRDIVINLPTYFYYTQFK